MAVGLAGSPFDLVVLSPDEAAGAERDPSVDLILIDVQATDRAVLLLRKLRDPEEPIPALVLAGPDWDLAPLSELAATSIVVRPVSQSSLVAALGAVLTPSRAAATPPTNVLADPATPPVPATSGVQLPDTPAAGPRRHRAREVPRPKPKPESPSRRLEPRPIELVHSLLPHAGELPWLTETSDGVLAHSLEVASAEAGAVLLQDGERWTVVAGTGLRPMELRYELGRDHWLVATVCRAEHAVVVADTDIARSQLSGAPLASWRNLIAVPIPTVEGILLLARRGDPGFTEGDLERLSEVSREAAGPLADAVEVRQLARELAIYVASAASG